MLSSKKQAQSASANNDDASAPLQPQRKLRSPSKRRESPTKKKLKQPTTQVQVPSAALDADTPDGTLYKCFARTSSQQMKVRYISISDDQTLNLMHLRKGTSNSMSITIQEDLTKAHIIKRTSMSLAELSATKSASSAKNSDSTKSSADSQDGQKVYPLSIFVMPKSKLVVYFDCAKMRQKCFLAILGSQGYTSHMDQYQLYHQPLSDSYHDSSVIKGTHKVTGKTVAIKVFSKQQIQEDSQQLIELEVRQKLQAFKSHGITKLIESFEDQQFVYQVTSLMNMGSAQKFMEQHSSIPYLTLQEMQTSARQLASALAVIHTAGYLHNDIQPGNVLLNRDNANRVSVSLNGLSRCSKQQQQLSCDEETSVESKNASPPSQINEFSYLYLAPEMILSQGTQRSQATDVWSLGILFYAFACGRLPFAGIHEIINQPLNWDYVDMMRIKLNTPFKNLITSMLNKDAANRPTSAQVYANAWLRQV